jgi:hypothetical protein
MVVQAAEEEEENGVVDYYFYRHDPEGSLYINDLEIPPDDATTTTDEKPDFLYAPTKEQGVRIVEYYAHWCPYVVSWQSDFFLS